MQRRLLVGDLNICHPGTRTESICRAFKRGAIQKKKKKLLQPTPLWNM